MEKEHFYKIKVKWTGDQGAGTQTYTSYNRDHEISSPEKHIIEGSSDPSFRGNPLRYNPEELMISTLSSCHMLFYLHLCAVNKITVVSYEDQATGVMCETNSGGGHFTETTLKPDIIILEHRKLNEAIDLHHRAHDLCFIANSVNFKVIIEPTINVRE